MSDSTTVTVSILDKEFQVSCQPEEVDELTASAAYLDKQMIQIRQTGKVVGLDRIAVMAALNITHQLLQQQDVAELAAGVDESRLSTLANRLGEAIAECKAVAS